MHDTSQLEARGVPAVMVASSEFTEAADSQAAALGFEPTCVYVPHPIQDRTDEEMRTLADEALENVIAALTVFRRFHRGGLTGDVPVPPGTS